MAPSWSWANVNAPIMSDQRYYMKQDKCSSCAEISEVLIRSDHTSGLYNFVASSLTLRGIAIYARAKPRVTPEQKSSEPDDCWELQLDQHDETVCIPVSIMWDESMLDPETNLKRCQGMLEDRKSTLLCLFINIDCFSFATGLLLKKLPQPIEDVVYVRVGVFVDFDGSLSHFLSENLDSPVSYSDGKDIDLDDPGLQGLVHQVTIV